MSRGDTQSNEDRAVRKAFTPLSRRERDWGGVREGLHASSVSFLTPALSRPREGRGMAEAMPRDRLGVSGPSLTVFSGEPRLALP